MATTVALDDKLQMSLDSLIKLQSKAKTAKAGAAPKAKTGSTAKKKGATGGQKDARGSKKHAGVLAPQNGSGVAKKKKKSDAGAKDAVVGKAKKGAHRKKPTPLDYEEALRTADELHNVAARLLQQTGAPPRRKLRPAAAAPPQYKQHAPQQRPARRDDGAGPSRRTEREDGARRRGGDRGFEERGGFLPGAKQSRHAEAAPRYSQHDDRSAPPPQQVIREIRYVPMPAHPPEPRYAEAPAAWAAPVPEYQPPRQPFQPARQPPQYVAPQHAPPQRMQRQQQPQQHFAPAPAARAPRGQQMHPLYDDERVAAAGSAGFSDDEMDDAVGGAIVKEEPGLAARPTPGHWTRTAGRHPANAIGWVAPDGTIVYTKKQ